MDTAELARTTVTHAGAPLRRRALAIDVALGGLLVLSDGEVDGGCPVALDAARTSVARSAHGCCS